MTNPLFSLSKTAEEQISKLLDKDEESVLNVFSSNLNSYHHQIYPDYPYSIRLGEYIESKTNNYWSY